MRRIISGRRQPFAAAFLFFLVCLCTGSAFAYPVENLNSGRWSLISIPADPGATGTVEALFGDDLPVAQYGSNWLIYAYDSAANQYRLLALDEPMEANRGYWIFQRITDPATVDIPESLSPLTGTVQTGCPEGQQCVSVSLTSNAWNTVGYSSESLTLFGDTRFVTASGVCADGCTPSQALTANVAQSVMFSLNSEGTAYEVITEATPMQPWDGYWLLALPDADQLRWVVPVGVDEPTPPVVTPPNTNPPMLPALTDPLPGTQFSGSDVTFRWEDNEVLVDQWFLRVGLSTGSAEFAEVRLTDPATRQFTVSGLPTNGVPIFVELSFRSGGVWTVQNYEYEAFDDNAVNPGDFVLVNDSITGLLGGQPVSGDVSLNDTIPSDAAQQGLLYAVTRPPGDGSVRIDAVSGVFTYQPDSGFAGDDFFIYSIVQFDDNQTPVAIVASARVDVTIEGLTLVDDSLTALSGVTVGDSVLSNDSLPANAAERGLRLQVVEQPANGFVELDPLNGTYEYVSIRGFSGSDNFIYGAVLVDENEQVVTVAAQATVSVNVEPIIVEDDQFAGVSGQALFGATAANDRLPQAAAVRGLLLRITTQPENGTVEMNPASGDFTYIPSNSFFGTDAFTYALVQVDEQGTEVGVISDDARVQIDVSAPVTFYRDPNFQGISWSTGADDDPDPTPTVDNLVSLTGTPVGINTVSSIRVAPGFSVFACVGPATTQIRCATYTDDVPELRTFFNNQIDVIRVTRLQPEIVATPNGILSDYTVSGLSGVGTGDTVMSGAFIGVSEPTLCANEGEICTLPEGSTATVFYGASQFSVTQIDNVSGSIACTNEVFGDPSPGLFKSCTYVAEFRAPGLTLESDQGYVVTGQPSRGTVLMSPSGRYLYSPAGKFGGTDSFQYALVRFNQAGGVAETLAQATVTLDYAGFLYLDSEDGPFDNAIGTYELDADGNPTNLRGVLLRSNFADIGAVALGTYRELPRLFLIRNAGANATSETVLEWNGSTGILANGGAVPLQIIWDDPRFNAGGLNLVNYQSTDDGELLIGFEDDLNGGDGDFTDTVMRLSFDPTTDQ